MSFLSAQPWDWLSPGNVALYAFLLGNFLLYVFVDERPPATVAPDEKATQRTKRTILVVLFILSVIAIETGIFEGPQAPVKAGDPVPPPPGAADFFFGLLNGLVAVGTGAIASTLTAAVSEKARASMGFAPRTATARGVKPLISSWL